MAEIVPETDSQALHHFLAHSPWDSRAVMDQVARDVDVLLGGDADSCLLLDETCFPKKGKKSVGVTRQWMGGQGKTDNCQVAVFAALARGQSVSMIDAELYLPQEWVKDPERCAAAGIPRERERQGASRFVLADEGSLSAAVVGNLPACLLQVTGHLRWR